MIKKILPPEEYFQSLPKKRMGAGALILNAKGEILLVKPSYKDHWSIPGGVIDENESPRAACIREVKEEIGLELKKVGFLCVDYIFDAEGSGENLQFIFFSGVLNEDEIEKIRLDGEELVEYRFATLDEALPLLGKRMQERLPKTLEALKNHSAVYLEDGK